MGRIFTVEPLPKEQALVAYPLIVAVFPAVGIQQWWTYVNSLTEAPPNKSGVLALRSEVGYFCGLLIYRNDRAPWHEPRLDVDLFLTLDLIDSSSANNAMLKAAEEKAIVLACSTIFIRLDGGSESMRIQLRQAGYTPTDGVVTKKIGAPVTQH